MKHTYIYALTLLLAVMHFFLVLAVWLFSEEFHFHSVISAGLIAVLSFAVFHYAVSEMDD